METTNNTTPPDVTGVPPPATGSPFRFGVGQTYETQAGNRVTVIDRYTKFKGYECLVCSDGKHRYDRSNDSNDAGRVTGTAHDYSDPANFKRANDKFRDTAGT